MSHHITATEELAGLIAPFHAHPPKVIGVDTEFMRRTTYWPKLCLIQLALDDVICTIDPLGDVDLKLLTPLLTNPHVPKVFHAAAQDVACLEHAVGERIAGIFDLQIAAMCLYPNHMPSYQALVHQHTGLTLEKGPQTMDWSKRPLTDRALDYARSDVLHLSPLFNTLKEALQEKNRLDWMMEETLREGAPCALKPWQKIRKWTLLESRPASLTLLMRLALWREHEARTQNRPRQKIASDETLYHLAEHASSTNIKGHVSKELGHDVWNYVQQYNVSLPPHVKALTVSQKNGVLYLRTEAFEVES